MHLAQHRELYNSLVQPSAEAPGLGSFGGAPHAYGIAAVYMMPAARIAEPASCTASSVLLCVDVNLIEHGLTERHPRGQTAVLSSIAAAAAAATPARNSRAAIAVCILDLSMRTPLTNFRFGNFAHATEHNN
eukprot:497105-Pleurochrysis_carterae.AAC.1